MSGALFTVVARPITFKPCLDQCYIESILAFGFIPSVSTFGELQDGKLRAYLEIEASTSNTILKINKLKCPVLSELEIDMRDENDVSSTGNLFSPIKPYFGSIA